MPANKQPGTTQSRDFRLADAYEMFLLDVQSRRLTEYTLKFYQSTLTRFLAWCADRDIANLSQVTHVHLRTFLAELQRRGLSSHTQHKYARSIKAFFNFCVRDELLDKAPSDKIQMPKLEQKVLKSFTPDEVKRILKAAISERDKAIVLLLLDSGLRASELLALDIEDIDMHTGAVSVVRGKGQKGRTVYTGAKTRKQLVKHLTGRKHGALFLSQLTGERLTVWGLNLVMRRIEERSGVPDVGAHAFRRTFAIEFLRGGGNIYILARLMGHSGIDVLRHYLAFVEQDLQQAQAKHGVVDRIT